MTAVAVRPATPADSEFCFQLHKAAMGRGIGTRLITALIDEARQRGQDLVLDVLSVNHRAQALYQRLGMKEVARHGDNNIKITMRSTTTGGQADDQAPRQDAQDAPGKRSDQAE
jgi:N-acetylglutamate synthase-like GNAT family acetyltransferase